ncbi:cell division protein FtsQ/DivIB [Roseococcus sp. SDR]|uniref:cell division protein FtsQ/DivIB n=1 Tax=Roseococcus sp. SDR TaxID=2835532 RepID=UPI001BCAC880|nr:cell division protein FtsQ/DivIB [Roseococcus sp. SDR]MBS7793104.1 cell division protein FtsQ/DivIB [Roseococcus sp. SDR]MBV1848418.1 cell division protein FtsQ/DivIB [Roseococcus sp. SDR]
MARKPSEPTTRTRTAPPPKRPSATRLWFKKRRAWLRGIGMVTLAGVTVGAGVLGVIALDPMARVRETTSWLAELGRGPGLSVQEIRIEGREFAPREALLAAIGITPGEAILDFEPSAAKQRLEQIAWVETAHVERRLPGTILIRITERRAFAVWQREGRFSVIDREGRVMATERLEAFGPLPLVVGIGAERVAAPMVDLLRSTPEIADRVQAIIRVSERRWNLRLHNGADILLPEGHEEAAITRLAELQARDRLLDRPLAAVDMRLPDRLVVRMQTAPQPTPASSPARSQRG